MGKFKKGVVFGGMLGAGLMWLNTTKKGREVRDSLLDHAAIVYGQVKEKVIESDDWETMTKNQYVTMVMDIVDHYAIQNGLSDQVKGMVIKLVTAQWKNLKKEVQKPKK